MQSQFSPPLTRLDAVLWFLRVQLWLSVVNLFLGLAAPFGFRVSLGLQSLVTTGPPLLILALFPRLLASAMLGATARDNISSLPELRPLVGRCVGAALFINSLGRAIALTFWAFYALFQHKPILGSALSVPFAVSQLVAVATSFLLGFALAFGPAIRDSFRAR